jgi:hypothetical protein
MNKIFKIICWVLGLIGLALGIWAFAAGGDNEAPVDAVLRYTYFLFIAAVVIWIGLAIYITARNNPKGLLRGLIVLVVAAVIVLIAYALASGAPAYNVKLQPSQSTLKFADTMLMLTYILGGAAICAILFSVIYNAVKK